MRGSTVKSAVSDIAGDVARGQRVGSHPGYNGYEEAATSDRANGGIFVG